MKETSAFVRSVILGGQDGLVNVLGIVLAIAKPTQNKHVILISGLASTFAESISMAAVAYTSAQAGKEYYAQKMRKVEKSVEGNAKREVRKVLRAHGFEGSFLNKAISYFVRDKQKVRKLLDGQANEFDHPVRDAVVVGFAALLGSVVPLIAFLFLYVGTAVWATLVISTLVLFIAGLVKGKYTGVSPLKSGVELAIVGMVAAIAGYGIGALLGALPG